MKLIALTRFVGRSVSRGRAMPALALLALTLGVAAPAKAQVIEMMARLDGLQETPSNTSPGRGIAFFSIDTTADTITYRILYTGLTTAESAAHIHGFAGPGVAAPILFALPLGSLKCGVISYTPAQEPNILAGMTYVNIHTTMFSGGEIRGQISELEAHATYCYGDGSGTACPCANNSGVGDTEGCLHSFGTGGRLVAYGNAQVSNDTIELHFLRGPPSTAVLFFQGTFQIAGGAGQIFGDGLRCAGGNASRLAIKQTCNGQAGLPEPGDAPLHITGAVPALTSGVLYQYQAWYRNSAVFCSVQTFNLTNAVEILWTP